MTELERLVARVIGEVSDRDFAAQLIVKLVASGLGKLGGRRKTDPDTTVETRSEPVHNPLPTPSEPVTAAPPPPLASPLPPIPDPGFLPGACDPRATEPVPPAHGLPSSPDTPHGLIQAIRVAVEREQPGLGFWQPGKFADKDAREFCEAIPPERKAEAPKAIRERVDVFASDARYRDDGWSLAAFIRAFNAIGSRAGPGAPRKLVRAPANWRKAETLT